MQKPGQRGEQFAFKFFAEKRGVSAVEIIACVGRGKLADGFDVCRLVYAIQIPARAQFADWRGRAYVRPTEFPMATQPILTRSFIAVGFETPNALAMSADETVPFARIVFFKACSLGGFIYAFIYRIFMCIKKMKK